MNYITQAIQQSYKILTASRVFHFPRYPINTHVTQYRYSYSTRIA